MHYWVDGYNLLFRLRHGHPDPNLQQARQFILEELNQKISFIHLDISIVFDATWQAGERSRSHLGPLEVLFTAQGETADEYILDELRHLADPRQETVVTSDKTLASHARSYRAHTQTVEEFIHWLNRLYKNRLQRKKQEKLIVPLPSSHSPPLPPPKKASLEGSYEAYLEVFEERNKQLLEEEKERREAIPPKKKSRRPKCRRDPFKEGAEEESPFKTDEERWLEAFERRSQKGEM